MIRKWFSGVFRPDRLETDSVHTEQATITNRARIEEIRRGSTLERWAGWTDDVGGADAFVFRDVKFTNVPENEATAIYSRVDDMGNDQLAANVNVMGRTVSGLEYWFETVAISFGGDVSVVGGSTVERGTPPTRSYTENNPGLDLEVGEEVNIAVDATGFRVNLP